MGDTVLADFHQVAGIVVNEVQHVRLYRAVVHDFHTGQVLAVHDIRSPATCTACRVPHIDVGAVAEEHDSRLDTGFAE